MDTDNRHTRTCIAPFTGLEPRRRRWAILGALAGLMTTLIAPLPATADGGVPMPAPTSCASHPGMANVAFPLGKVPPVLPAPQVHQLRDEYAAVGLLFSDDDGDLPSTHRRFQPATTTYNVVRQGTLSNVFRMDLRRENVTEVKVVVVDSNLNDTIHKLTAFDAMGRQVGHIEHRDWQGTGHGWFFVSVASSPSRPISSVVFTQANRAGKRWVYASAVTCVAFGPSAPAPAPSPTTTPPAPTTTAPAPTTTASTTIPAAAPTTTPRVSCPTRTIPTNADAWFEQNDTTTNKGDDSTLKVQSKSGDDAMRAVVDFPLPPIPAGCRLASAELRLYADGSKPGRTIAVQRAATAWSEAGVNWGNQPPGTGPIATSASGADKGWKTWTVTALVLGMYESQEHHGFVVRDTIEDHDAEQAYNGREKGENVPTLAVHFEAAPT